MKTDNALESWPAPLDWESIYQHRPVEEMPWFLPQMDMDLARALKERDLHHGRFLDIGCGPGTQAVSLARKGFEVVGCDISNTALQNARERANAANVNPEFVQDDILRTRVRGKYDYILDRGCLQVLPAESRHAYLASVERLVQPNGLLFLKTFSHLEPGRQGPYRFSPTDIQGMFEKSFEVELTEDTVFQGTRLPLPKALFCVLRRKAS